MTNGKISIATALISAVATLTSNKNIVSPRLDAEVLLAFVLDTERISLIINKDKELNDIELEKFNEFILRRKNNEPISYITGKKEFMSLEFDVEKGVLIPRPDTEVLVEEIIGLYKGKSAKILDLCTGSGAISVSLAYYLPDAQLTALDKYDISLKLARQNVKKHNLSDRVNVISGDVLNSMNIDGNFDCIVSNPPYIRNDVLKTLSPDVKDFEPAYALSGGDDGLIFYRKITEYAKNKLNRNGVLAFEIGYDQSKDVKTIIKDCKAFKNIKIVNDLAGLNRVILAEKR